MLSRSPRYPTGGLERECLIASTYGYSVVLGIVRLRECVARIGHRNNKYRTEQNRKE